MSGSINPPKLNYAKSRNKSKNKYESGLSQQKISLQGESSSDIFAHLNQDNLNYIKKQLKNKKSISTHDRTRSTVVPNIIQHGGDLSEMNCRSVTQIEAATVDNKKIYEKYKNQNEVQQRDARQQQTMRQTQNDEDLEQSFEHVKAQSKIQALHPPPSTLKKQSLPSTESQHLKTASLQIQQVEKPKENQSNLQKSQLSHNRLIADSVVSVDNNLSEASGKASQFLDYLQSYILELNRTPQKSKQILKIRKIQSQPNALDVSSSPSQFAHIQRFKKDKRPYADHPKPYLNTQRQQQFHQFPSKSKITQPQFEWKDNENNYDYQIGTNRSDYKDQQVYQQFSQQSLDKKEIQKQKYYSVVLAQELQKYKQSQQRYRRQIQLLTETIRLLKKQAEYLAFIIQQQVTKNTSLRQHLQSQQKPVLPDFQLTGKQNRNNKEPIIGYPSYQDLDPKLYQKLNDNFVAGQQHFSKVSRLPSQVRSKPFSYTKFDPSDLTRPLSPRQNSLSKLKQEYAQFKLNALKNNKIYQ